jgi:hypothetical protein
MWPFWTAPVVAELEKRVDKLEADKRLIERDLEDLHARYRRLRATQGGDARVAAASVESNLGDPGAALTTKNALRARFFGKRTQPGGNGE